MIITNSHESSNTSVDQAKAPTAPLATQDQELAAKDASALQGTEPKVSAATPRVEPQAMEGATEVEQRVQEVAQKIDTAASELALQATNKVSDS